MPETLAGAADTGKVNASLPCIPYCLFNLTADLGEEHDLASDPSYAPLAASMRARLEYHGSTGPPQAFVFPEPAVYRQKVDECFAVSLTKGKGFLQPLDL